MNDTDASAKFKFGNKEFHKGNSIIMRQLLRSPKTLENKEEEKKRNVDESEKISRGGNFQGPTRHLHRRVFDELLKQ